MEYVVDMQKQPVNDFILKELAILPLDEKSEPLVLMCREPYPWRRLANTYRRENMWLERSYHGLAWKFGDVLYTDVKKIVRDSLYDATKVFVQGVIRKEWLRRFKVNAVDIVEYGYPGFCKPEKMVTVCTNHNEAYKAACALRNVKQMKIFYFKYICMNYE